jgi:hypothetical protein
MELPEPKAKFLRNIHHQRSTVLFLASSAWFPSGSGIAAKADKWLNQNLGTFDGYMTVSQAFSSLDRCEPKLGPFPF